MKTCPSEVTAPPTFDDDRFRAAQLEESCFLCVPVSPALDPAANLPYFLMSFKFCPPNASARILLIGVKQLFENIRCGAVHKCEGGEAAVTAPERPSPSLADCQHLPSRFIFFSNEKSLNF